MKIHIVDQAENDFVDGYNFYEDQAPGLGEYFLDCIYSDVESLVLYAGNIGSSTRFIDGCCQKDFLLQFTIPLQEMR